MAKQTSLHLEISTTYTIFPLLTLGFIATMVMFITLFYSMHYFLFALLLLMPSLIFAQEVPVSNFGENLTASLAIFSMQLDIGFKILLLLAGILVLVTFGVCISKLVREDPTTRQKEVVPATLFLGVLIALGAYVLIGSDSPMQSLSHIIPSDDPSVSLDAALTSTPTLRLRNSSQKAIRGGAVDLVLTGASFVNGSIAYQATCAPSNTLNRLYASFSINADLVSDTCIFTALQNGKKLATLTLPVIDSPTLATTLPAECTSSKASANVTPGLSLGSSAEYSPFVLCSGLPITLNSTLKLLIEKGGNIKLYSKVNTVDPILLWESGTSADCSNNSCRLRLQSDGNLVLTRSESPIWGSSTFGASFSLLLSDTVPFIGMVKNHALAWSPILGSQFKPNTPNATGVFGWTEKIFSEDGVVQGWATNGKNLAENLTIKFKIDGKEIGSTVANGVNKQLLYDWGLLGSYGFSFRIPDAYQNNVNHTLEVVAVSSDGTAQVIPGPASTKTFSLKTNAKVSWANGLDCITPGSTCASSGYDFDAPNFTKAQGWSDGKNYFTEWKCTSTVGINNIARLNIAPQGSHGFKFQKDSTYMNQYEKLMGGAPTVYFTTTRADFHGLFSVKKAAYDASTSQWKIFDVLDYPSSEGGFSSFDGVYPNYIVQDYSAPGLGPTSPLPGNQTKIPSVSNIPLNPEKTSYALEGFGPLGLTTITNYAQTPDPGNGAIAGKTCVHWNPKFFDYDSNGIPRAMLTFLSLANTTKPCTLPSGKQVFGGYVYRADPKLGWQLDLSYDPAINRWWVAKLLWGTKSTFIGGDWDGTISTHDLTTGKKETLLNCGGSGAKFAEASGSKTQIIFAAVPPGDIHAGVDSRLFNGDIFYAFKN